MIHTKNLLDSKKEGKPKIFFEQTTSLWILKENAYNPIYHLPKKNQRENPGFTTIKVPSRVQKCSKKTKNYMWRMQVSTFSRFLQNVFSKHKNVFSHKYSAYVTNIQFRILFSTLVSILRFTAHLSRCSTNSYQFVPLQLNPLTPKLQVFT